jgi:hypothetical protein
VVALLHGAHGALARILVRVASDHVVEQALAHGALRPAHLLDAKLRKDLGQDRHAAGKHGTPVIGDAFQRDCANAPRCNQRPDNRLDAIGGNAGGLRVQRLLHLEDRAHGAGTARDLFPAALQVGFLHRFQFLLCGQARTGKALAGDLAVTKMALAHQHASQLQALQLQWLDATPDDHFRAAAANVHDQAVVGGVGQGLDHPGINQACFLAPGNDFYPVSQCFAGAVEKGLAIARLAQGTGAHHAHAPGVQVLKPLAEAAQAVQRPRCHVLVEPTLFVHAFGDAHRFAQAVQHDELPVGVTGNDQVKAVGSQVDRGQDVRHARRATTQDLSHAANEDPQPQVVVALGLRITNCAPSNPSR